jgi:hypothetical protein
MEREGGKKKIVKKKEVRFKIKDKENIIDAQ